MKSIFAVLVFAALAAQAEDRSILCGQDTVSQISFSIQPQARPASKNELTLISWNAHKLSDGQFFYDLKRLAADADLLMIQEAIHTTDWQNAFASHFRFEFSFNKSFCWSGVANGVMTASRSGLMNNLALASPGVEPGSFTHKVSGYSQMKFGSQTIHLINTHALNFNLGSDFEQQIDQITQFISKASGPIIWAGDFNTWNSSRKNYLADKVKSLGLTHLAPANDNRFLVLDHIYVRGLVAIKTEVLNETSSDHYPIKTTLKLMANPGNPLTSLK